jgi:hypothetical protein
MADEANKASSNFDANLNRVSGGQELQILKLRD